MIYLAWALAIVAGLAYLLFLVKLHAFLEKPRIARRCLDLYLDAVSANPDAAADPDSPTGRFFREACAFVLSIMTEDAADVNGRSMRLLRTIHTPGVDMVARELAIDLYYETLNYRIRWDPRFWLLFLSMMVIFGSVLFREGFAGIKGQTYSLLASPDEAPLALRRVLRGLGFDGRATA